MKRSQINRIIEESRQHFADFNCHLPKWAFWSPKDWEQASEVGGIGEVTDHGLGWIVTDFGTDEFDRFGLVLFVVRNGCLQQEKPVTTKTYAEKFMLAKSGQTTPYHFHWKKTEDLLNRSGGRLNVQLAWAAKNELSMTDEIVKVQMDGITKMVKPSEIICLEPGQSIELTPRMCHQFSGHPKDKVVLAGEISSLNDDAVDNCFLGRNVQGKPIEEDEPKKFLLSSELKAHCVSCNSH